MDEVVGICVLLGGKVVQVGQVPVLGDRERRAYSSEARAQSGSRGLNSTSVYTVSDLPELYMEGLGKLSSLCQGLHLGMAHRNSFKFLRGFCSF